MVSSVKILKKERNSFGTVSVLTFSLFRLYCFVNVEQRDSLGVKYFVPWNFSLIVLIMDERNLCFLCLLC